MAWAVVQEATGQSESTPETDERVLRGASEGGRVRASKLTPAERSEIAKKAAAARWGQR